MATLRKRWSFDRQRQIDSLPVLLQVDRNAKLDDELKRNNAGTRAGYILNDVAKATLLGLEKETRDLLEKAHLWLTTAIERGEDTKMYGTRASFHRNLAICNWLRGEGNDAKNFADSCRELEKSIADRGIPWTSVHELDIDWYMGAAVQAQFASAVSHYEAHPKCSRDVTHKTVGSLRGLAYLMLRQQPRASAPEITAAGERMLRKMVPVWLEHGGFLEIAMWSKVLRADQVLGLRPAQITQTVLDFI